MLQFLYFLSSICTLILYCSPFCPFNCSPFLFISVFLVFVSVESNTKKNERTWTVEFQNAGYQLPLFAISNLSAKQNALISFENRNNQQNTETIVRNNHEIHFTIIYCCHQFISNFFELFVGNLKFQISSNISAEDLGSVLESVPKVSAVGVVRSSVGLDGGHKWIVTFYSGTFFCLFICFLIQFLFLFCFLYVHNVISYFFIFPFLFFYFFIFISFIFSFIHSFISVF